MSLRNVFLERDLEELQRRLDRIDTGRPDRWLDSFPELWLHDGAQWSREAQGTLLRDAAGTVQEHPFALLEGEPGAWGYLCASLLHRECFAGERPRWVLARPTGLRLAENVFPADLPTDWRPCVIEDNTRVTVILHVQRESQLLALEDRYPAQGFEFEARERLLGWIERG